MRWERRFRFDSIYSIKKTVSFRVSVQTLSKNEKLRHRLAEAAKRLVGLLFKIVFFSGIYRHWNESKMILEAAPQ